MMKCLTFEHGHWVDTKWIPDGKATVHTDLIGAVVDYKHVAGLRADVPGCQILGAGFAITVNLPREKVVQLIRNAEAGRLDFGVVS
jgi:hypothetical protein